MELPLESSPTFGRRRSDAGGSIRTSKCWRSRNDDSITNGKRMRSGRKERTTVVVVGSNDTASRLGTLAVTVNAKACLEPQVYVFSSSLDLS